MAKRLFKMHYTLKITVMLISLRLELGKSVLYTIPLRRVAEPGLMLLTLVLYISGTLSMTFLLPASSSKIFLPIRLGSMPVNSKYWRVSV